MYQVQIPWNKVFKGLKYLLILLILVGIGYVGYLTYYFATNSPQEVRVTNLTGSSATVSWYTNRPDGGVVYVKDKNSFTPVFSKLGSTVAYDDRDVAIAQETWVNKQVSKATNDVDADYEVTLDEKALNELPVKKKGKYYVHHVTINNLQEEKQYYFRVGNGVFMWNVNENNQKYSEYEAPTVKEFGFKTYKDPENLPSPSPIYGTVYSLARNKDGFLTQNLNTDSIVFVHSWKEDEKVASLTMSSITNKSGGWTLDKSNVRDNDGSISSNYEVGEDKLYAYVQLENVKRSDLKEMVWGVNDAPAPDLLVNNEADAKVLGSILDVLTYKLANLDINNVDYTFNTYAINNMASCEDEGGTWSGGKCNFGKVEPIVKPPANNNTNNTNTGNTSSNNCKYRFNGVCIEEEPEEIKPPAPATPTSVAGGDNNGGNANTGSGNTPVENDQLDCGGMEKKKVGGNWICVNSSAQNAKDGATCTGQHPRGCEVGDGCYCQWNDGSGGYSRLENVSCRPAACASNVNGDYATPGNLDSLRVKLGTDNKPIIVNGQPVLCGADTSTNGCVLNTDKPTRDGTLICRTGYKVEISGNKKTCVPDPGYNNGSTTPLGDNTSLCTYKDSITCSDYTEKLSASACAQKQRTGTSKCNEKIDCVYEDLARGATTVTNISRERCNELLGNRVACVNGQIPKGDGSCTCPAGWVSYSSNGSEGCTNPALQPVNDRTGSGKCSVRADDNISKSVTLNCGRQGDNKCYEGDDTNYGCESGEVCAFVKSSGVAGVCMPKGEAIGFTTAAANQTNPSEVSANCFIKVDTNGEIVDTRIASLGQWDTRTFNNSSSTTEAHWVKTWVSVCLSQGDTGSLNSDTKDNNTAAIVNKALAASNVEYKTNGNHLVIFPESGIYDVTIGEENFKNIFVDKNNQNFFYKDNNGEPGYQLPEDPKKPSKNDDVLLPASGAVVTLYEKAKNQSMKLSKGINIVSFNYLPSRVEGKNMNAKQLMRILNSSGTKVTRITTFEGGKWLGGLAYDSNKGEIVGNDFLVLPGKGYLIVSNADYTATVPGYGIKNSIPVALSDGWNLVGVNGFSKTYTAASMIKSVNELEGVGANNVTWWPTSKGRYESFQKSEDTEYGFDFPLLKDIGYFVRINKFDRDGAKSVIWNPGGDLHGENGSK